MKFAGIDWATETHFAALIGGDGEVLSEWSFPHSFEGLTSFVDRLKKEGGPAGVIVCVESGAPLVVDQLLHAGFTVYSINPKQADRYRDRYTVAGAKDDRRDALVLAQAVRTDRASMRPVEKDSDLAEEIRIRDRARTRKVEERTRLSNQLRQTLSRYFPVLIELGREMHDSFFLALLRVCPDPASAKKVRTPRLARLVEEHRIRAIDAKDLAKRLRAPALAVADYVAAACRDEVLDLVAQVELLNGQIAAADEKLDELTEGHPDHELYRSLPGLGKRLAARMVAELGDRRDRHPESSSLQAFGGTAPVTRRSGKRILTVNMRKGCNRTLQAAFFTMARCSLAKSAWAKAFYEDRRRKGQRHAAAVRALSNKWAKILWAVLFRRKTYDEACHVRHLHKNEVPWAKALPKEKAA